MAIRSLIETWPDLLQDGELKHYLIGQQQWHSTDGCWSIESSSLEGPAL